MVFESLQSPRIKNDSYRAALRNWFASRLQPAGCMVEVEEYAVKIEKASVVELEIEPDVGHSIALISVFLTGPVRRFVVAHPLNDRVL